LYQAVLFSSTVVRKCRFLTVPKPSCGCASPQLRAQFVTDRAYIPRREAHGFYARSINSIQLSPSIKQFLAAGILLGLGFGGFFDGIILHQILQWHHMLTNIRPMLSMADVKVNSTADGLFHLMDYGFTIAGVTLLWRTHQQTDMPKSAKPFIGSILVGAGLFNLIEGIIDHHILGIHYVHSGPHHLLWDIAFLASGALLIMIGAVLIDQWKTSGKSIT
jgi:uncharacterized membrane protein